MTTLNTKQQFAFDQILKGNNVFLSGPGGVGKSFITKLLMEKFYDSTVLLAPTGIAALNIEGSTIHSAFKFPTSVLTKYHQNNPSSYSLDLFNPDGPVRRIIIDEISMVRADLLIAIDINLRHIRRKNKAFGGLQVITVGDFFQLPPVLTDKEKEKFLEISESPFCFTTDTWTAAGFDFIELDQVMRQTDYDFINNLQIVRKRDEEKLNSSIKFFNNLSKKNRENIYELDPVFLCTTNKVADNINNEHYLDLNDEEHTFKAVWSHDMKTFPAPTELKLKYGTKVMFLANTESFKNGEIGYVTGFFGDRIEVTKDDSTEQTVLVEKHKWIDSEYQNVDGQLIKRNLGSFEQYPLKHAWAVTIHKSQGLTLPSAVIDFGRGCFTSGQAYVALSRVKNLDGLCLTRDIQKSDIIVSKEIVDFYNTGAKGNSLF